MAEIKLPFEPNEKVKKAFNREIAMKQSVEMITAALVEAASHIESGFETLRKEHPQLGAYKKIKYNHLTQRVELAE